MEKFFFISMGWAARNYVKTKFPVTEQISYICEINYQP